MRQSVLFISAVLLSLALARPAAARTHPVKVPPNTPTSSVTGTVVSSSGTELVLETPSGRQRFSVDSSSNVPANLAAGTRVTVDFHRLDGEGLHVARVTTSPRTEGATPPLAGTRTPADRPVDTPDPGAPVSRDPVMPATASPLAAIGLPGLLSLGGAAALSARRRRS